MGIAQYGGTTYGGTVSGGVNVPDLETSQLNVDGNNTKTKTRDELMKAFKINDDKPEFQDVLQQGDGTAIDLTNAESVKIFYEKPDGTVKSDTVTISGASKGKVESQFPTDEIDQVGTWKFEYRVTFTDGTDLTVPNGDDFELIEVGDRL